MTIPFSNGFRIHVFLQDKGLYTHDYKQQQLVLLNASIQRAYCMLDIKSALLLGAGASVFSIDEKSMVVSKLVSIDTVQRPNNTIWALLAEPNGQLWIGTTATGLEVLDPVSGRKKNIQPGDNKKSLTASSVYCVYEDMSLRKWVGTARGGINIFDPQKRKVETIAHDPATITGNSVSSIFQYSDSALWIGIEGAGLNAWNRKRNIGYRLHEITTGDALSLKFIVDIRKRLYGQYLADFIR